MTCVHLYTDGAARGNPGPAGAGIVVLGGDGTVIDESFRYLGAATNNVAEYEALISGLELCRKYHPCKIRVHMDSELVVRQLQGVYRVKNETLAGLYQKAIELLNTFESHTLTHIPREKNAMADKLANKAIDTHQATSK